jgi:phage anti-repressor protein
MTTHVGTDDPEEEIVHDPFTLDMDVVSAIRLVQKNERGRQGRYRIMLILKNLKQKKLENERNRKIREGLIKEESRD